MAPDSYMGAGPATYLWRPGANYIATMPRAWPQSLLCDLPEDMPEIARILTGPLPQVLADLVVDYWNPWPSIFDRTALSVLNQVIVAWNARLAYQPEPRDPRFYSSYEADAASAIPWEWQIAEIYGSVEAYESQYNRRYNTRRLLHCFLEAHMYPETRLPADWQPRPPPPYPPLYPYAPPRPRPHPCPSWLRYYPHHKY